MVFLRVALFLSVASFLQQKTDAMTIDKAIFSSAPNAGMYKNFHLMPEGDVKVMTEFDLLLTLEQQNLLYRGTTGRGKRKALREKDYHWKGCVVNYEIMDSLEDVKTHNVIKAAIADWEKYTCLSFKKNSKKDNRIQFKDGGGCYSQLGMQDKPQPIGLARGCRNKGVVIHEIGHALGLIHEHMRPDRDDFIKVNYKSIPGRFHSNYVKYNTTYIDSHGVPYDYTSIMHYGASVIPNSIQTLDKSFQDKIGQRKGLTFKDIKIVNLMYRCAHVMKCSNADALCPHGGFVFYKNYKDQGKCKCWCDSGDINDPLIRCDDRSRPIIPPPQPKPPTNHTEPPMECMDMHPDCPDFKIRGICMTEMELMMDVCAKTCDYCGKGTKMCMDHEKSCPLTAAAGLCKEHGFKMVMEKLCPDSCGLCPKPPTACDIQKEMLGDPQAGHQRDPGNRAVDNLRGRFVDVSMVTVFAFLLGQVAMN